MTCSLPQCFSSDEKPAEGVNKPRDGSAGPWEEGFLLDRWNHVVVKGCDPLQMLWHSCARCNFTVFNVTPSNADRQGGDKNTNSKHYRG